MKLFLRAMVGFAVVFFCVHQIAFGSADTVSVGIFIINPGSAPVPEELEESEEETQQVSAPGAVNLDVLRQMSERTNWFVIIRGETSPYAQVSVLRNGVRVGIVQANATGEFEAGVHNPQPGLYEWSVFVRDQLGLKSGAVSFTGEAREGVTVIFEPVIPPPTLYGVVGLTGTVYHIGGTTIPGHTVIATIEDQGDGSHRQEYRAIAGPDGRWVHSIRVVDMPSDYVIVLSKVEVGKNQSVQSLPITADLRIEKNQLPQRDVVPIEQGNTGVKSVPSKPSGLQSFLRDALSIFIPQSDSNPSDSVSPEIQQPANTENSPASSLAQIQPVQERSIDKSLPWAVSLVWIILFVVSFIAWVIQQGIKRS